MKDKLKLTPEQAKAILEQIDKLDENAGIADCHKIVVESTLHPKTLEEQVDEKIKWMKNNNGTFLYTRHPRGRKHWLIYTAMFGFYAHRQGDTSVDLPEPAAREIIKAVLDPDRPAWQEVEND